MQLTKPLFLALNLDDGYGAYLKERFALESLNLSGGYVAGSMRLGSARLLLESSSLSATPTYTNLNGEERSFVMKLDRKLVGLVFGDSDLEWAVGYGQDSLTRDIEGYKDTYVTTDNLEDNYLNAESTNSGSHYMVQGTYRLFGDSFTGEAGLRYDQGSILIPEDDPRPGLSEKGVPEDQFLDLSGWVLLLTFSYRF